jgi:acetoacetyl-CoA reductase
MSTNRTAFVTGGTGGIGTAICKRLCAAGVRVVAGCRVNSPRRQHWLAAMGSHGFEPRLVELDVADWDSVRSAVELVKSEVGPIDVLVNNAGITQDKSFRRMEREEWDRVINTNLSSVFYVTRHVLEDMIERGWGRIINIGSVNGQRGQAGQTNYAAAKAGIHGFTMSLAREVAQKNVTVNTVSPGYVETDMVNGLRADILQRIREGIPVSRFGRPDEIASLVAWLASDEAAFATGAEYSLNGGMHMH